MKVVGFNGSPRKAGNTAALMNYTFKELENQGIKTELVSFAGQKVPGCIGCFKCFENRDNRCAIDNDIVNRCLEKMIEAQGVILASPTYVSNITAEMKALIDRASMVNMASGNTLLRRKVGAAIVAARRAGSMMAFNSLNQFFLLNQMIIPGSRYWNIGIGLVPGDVEKDDEGISIMTSPGENMAWLLRAVRNAEE